MLHKSYNVLIGKPAAEVVKKEGGSAFGTGEERETYAKGRDLISGVPEPVRIRSREGREEIRKSAQAIVDAVRRAEITAPELASDIVHCSIVMTEGGMIRTPDPLISRRTGRVICFDDEPLTWVVHVAERVLADPKGPRGARRE